MALCFTGGAALAAAMLLITIAAITEQIYPMVCTAVFAKPFFAPLPMQFIIITIARTS